MPQRIVAIDLAGDTVRAAVAERTWNTLQFVGTFQGERATDESDLGGALSRLLERTGHPDILISALPSELVTKRLLELPFSDTRRLHQIVPFALEEHLPYPVDSAVVAFAVVGRQDDKSLVLAAFARKSDVQKHLELLAQAGLDPKTVTLAPYALAALFSHARNGAAPASHLLIETDRTATSLVLIDEVGIPRAMRTVGTGLLADDGTAQSADDVAPVINAVRQTILAHAEVEPRDVIVTGAGAAVAQLRTLLSESLSMAVRDATDFDCSAMFEGAQPDTMRYAAPVAMLLGEMPVHAVELLNFRRGEFEFRGRTRGDLTAFYTTFALAAVLAGMMFVNFGFTVANRIHRLRILDHQIAEIAAPALGEKNPSDPMAQLRSGISSMNKRLRQIGGNLARNNPLDALLAVSRALPARFPVEMQDVQIDALGLKLTGQADSFGTVDEVKRALDQSRQFGAIEVTHARAGSDPSKIEFRLNAQFRYGVGEGK
jgi:Type II secretion system (T2SS), protein L/Fimbrial assembly protein (PilN)